MKRKNPEFRKKLISQEGRLSAQLLPPRPSDVQAMADILLAARGSKRVSRVGKNWVHKYIKRRPELISRLSRAYNYRRAKCENPKIIKNWFERLQKMIADNGIQRDDIYNFDETGFAMGMIATTKVVTGSDVRGRKPLLQPGNREWVTAIECINASGWVLPSFVIFKGKRLFRAWYKGRTLPGWRVGVSQNGWSNNKLAVRWLQKIFIPFTERKTKGVYRLLILDGHGSHLTPKFEKICKENKIITICMPAHSSHILQPLDLVCFSVLKGSYYKMIEKLMRAQVNHITKFDFLAAYPNARVKAFRSENVISAFETAGIWPDCPERVLSKLTSELHTPSPRSEHEDQNEPRTPSNLERLDTAAAALRKMITEESDVPVNRKLEAVDQIVDYSKRALQSAALFAQDISDLKKANESQKRNRAQSRKRIKAEESDLSFEEALELIEVAENAPNRRSKETRDQIEGTSSPTKKARRACGICGTPGHRRETCSKKVG
ncbi:hypothetical protein OXX80_002219 [Metschnikowia pulcherrima]